MTININPENLIWEMINLQDEWEEQHKLHKQKHPHGVYITDKTLNRDLYHSNRCSVVECGINTINYVLNQYDFNNIRRVMRTWNKKVNWKLCLSMPTMERLLDYFNS